MAQDGRSGSRRRAWAGALAAGILLLALVAQTAAQAQAAPARGKPVFRTIGAAPPPASPPKTVEQPKPDLGAGVRRAIKASIGHGLSGERAKIIETEFDAALAAQPDERKGADAALRATIGRQGITIAEVEIVEFTFKNEPKIAAAAPAPVVLPAEAAIVGPDGGVQNPARWPATLYFDGLVPGGISGCTATLIGPRVLLTAAHCLGTARSVPLVVPVPRIDADQTRGRLGSAPSPPTPTKLAKPAPDGAPPPPAKVPSEGRDVVIDMTCTPHPGHAVVGGARYLDYGLCHLAEDFPDLFLMTRPKDGDPKSTVAERVAVEMRFERLSLDRAATSFDFRRPGSRRIFLAGYGCSSANERVRDGKLRLGGAQISNFGPLRLTIGSPWRNDSTILCAGDSGGAAYRYEGSRPDDRRLVVAVNSANIFARHMSFVSRTSAPAFVNFLEDWRRRWKMPKVCGLDTDIEARCRP